MNLNDRDCLLRDPGQGQLPFASHNQVCVIGGAIGAPEVILDSCFQGGGSSRNGQLGRV